MHKGVKPHTCDQCGGSFTSVRYLKIHQVHMVEKPYKCRYCEKSFTSGAKCTYHERGHTGEKPYTCDQCGKKLQMLILLQ